MNHLLAKKSSAFRGRRAARHLTAWFAILVQLVMMFHLELHQRVLGPRLLRDAATVSTAWTKSQTPPVSQPFCPACRIIRQGAVHPAVERLAWLPLRTVAAVPSGRAFSLPVIFLLYPSGRDPPRA